MKKMPCTYQFVLDLEEIEDGVLSITAEVWYYGNRKTRMDRMYAVSKNIWLNGWVCWQCGEKIPLYRRADARYCWEACRKAAARQRRADHNDR